MTGRGRRGARARLALPLLEFLLFVLQIPQRAHPPRLRRLLPRRAQLLLEPPLALAPCALRREPRRLRRLDRLLKLVARAERLGLRAPRARRVGARRAELGFQGRDVDVVGARGRRRRAHRRRRGGRGGRLL